MDLQVSREYKVKLTFEAFDIEYQRDCNYDFVMVSASLSQLRLLKLILKVSYGTFSEKYCGNTAPAPIISSGRTMRVQFYTDNSVQKTGFNAVWTAVPA